jgi:hypothetical protein
MNISSWPFTVSRVCKIQFLNSVLYHYGDITSLIWSFRHKIFNCRLYVGSGQKNSLPTNRPWIETGFHLHVCLRTNYLMFKTWRYYRLPVYKTWICFIRESPDGTRKFWKLLKIYDSSDSDWARRMRGWTRVWPGEGATPGLSSGSPPRGDCRHPELLRKKRRNCDWLLCPVAEHEKPQIIVIS